MVYSFDGHNYLIRLDEGEKLGESLRKFVAETNIDGAWLTVVGGALEVTLGHYNLQKKTYKWQTFKGMREVVGLEGNLGLDQTDQVIYHLHGTFADDSYQTVAGHVQDVTVAATMEIFAQRLDKPLRRTMDKAVGLQTLDVD